MDKSKELLEKRKLERLLTEANTAIAWGIPDRESTGYSREELIEIIRKLRDYITKVV